MRPEADPTRPPRVDPGEVLLAVAVVVLGAAVVWQTTQIRLTPAAPVGAGVCNFARSMCSLR